MKIYLLTTLDSVGYDEYDAVVVFAKSTESAKTIAQRCCNFKNNIECEYLGMANSKRKEGQILNSFNAG